MLQISDDFLKDEERNGFFISKEMKQAWAAEMKILDAVQTLCDRHDIKVFAIYGTLLGAIRHKGFIPWDDDIDLAMTRDDYMRFLSVAEELGEPYFVKSLYSMEGFRQYHAVVCNTKSTEFTWSQRRIEQFYGCPYLVGIDIFPLDYISDNPEKRRLQQLLYYLGYGLTMDTKQKELPDDYNKRLQIFTDRLGIELDPNKETYISDLMRVTDQIAAWNHPEESTCVGYYPETAYQGEVNAFDKKWFSQMQNMPFEDMQIHAPIGAVELTEAVYGKDYMTPIQNRAGHDYPFYAGQKEYFEYFGYM